MMKHTLEKLLAFGRTIADAPPTRIGTNNVFLDVDNKVLLMSNYVSRRVFELSGQELEISFMYGGTVIREQHKTTLKIDSFYIPPKQRITHGSFTSSTDSTYDANQFFARQNKRLVAIGHSHANYDVFHSATDLENYKNLVGTIGVKVEHPAHTYAAFEKVYSSVSTRLGKLFSVTTPVHAPTSFSYILPSFVFNAKGECVDTIIASKSYSVTDGNVQTKFEMHDAHLRVYNKQVVLTSDEKRMLDFAIRRVLSYNNLLRRY